MGEKTEVLLFGLGAVGGFYAFILGSNKTVSLSVVARSNYDAVKAKGLKVESETHGDQNARIDHIYKSPSEGGKIFDYIVCTNKAINIGSTPNLFEDVADDRTTFVLIQNGVGNEDPFRKCHPKCTILSVVAWVNCQQTGPEIIKHKTLEETEIGLFPNENLDANVEKKRLDGFVNLLRDGGTNVTPYENIQVKRWEKVIWNAAWNSISTITQTSAQFWMDSSPEAVTMIKRLMREMVDVAKQVGVKLDPGLPEQFCERMAQLKDIYGSMYVDMKHGRPLEVEVILENPLKKASASGVETPTLEAFYSIVKAIDGRIRSGG